MAAIKSGQHGGASAETLHFRYCGAEGLLLAVGGLWGGSRVHFYLQWGPVVSCQLHKGLIRSNFIEHKQRPQCLSLSSEINCPEVNFLVPKLCRNNEKIPFQTKISDLQKWANWPTQAGSKKWAANNENCRLRRNFPI